MEKENLFKNLDGYSYFEMVKVWMVFEALGTKKDGVEGSLDNHIETLRSENGVDITEVERDDVEKIKDPHEDIDEGYSQVLEVRAKFNSFERAVRTVINYGPTYIQMEEPDVYDLDLSEAQDVLQKMATTMHQYAQMGAGGVLVSKTGENNN